MSEYLEAISRLNAPERNPGISISRSLFPIPRRDTPINMNRIMAETLNTPTNKYSIPQVLNIMNCLNERYFTFPLDKHFLLAKGGRKSIGLRSTHFNINLNNIANQMNGLKVRFNITFKCFIEGMTEENEDAYLNEHANLNNIEWSSVIPVVQKMTFEYEKSLKNQEADYSTLQSDIATACFNLINNDIPNVGLSNVDNEIGLQLDSFDEIVIFNPRSYVQVNVEITSVGTYTNNNVWTPKPDSFRDFIYGGPYFTNRTLVLENGAFIKMPTVNLLQGAIQVCSSINPWSPGCIIAPVVRLHDVINRVFPYDNQQEIKIWFVDGTGRVLPNYNNILNGYLELELIIDNENNFTIDQD